MIEGLYSNSGFSEAIQVGIDSETMMFYGIFPFFFVLTNLVFQWKIISEWSRGGLLQEGG